MWSRSNLSADSIAQQLGLKLVIVFVNNWSAFGGMQQYVNWVEGNSGKHDDFYTNPKIIQDFENYIHFFITRTNHITGVSYADDPTVMAWELANEPRDESDPSGQTLANWAGTISSYIHSIDPNHMIAVGDEGWMGLGSTSQYPYPYSNYEGVVWSKLLALPYISYGTYHLYPHSYGQTSAWGNKWISDHITAANQAGKPAVLEEFGDKANATGRDGVYQAWTNTVYQDGGAGAMFWMLNGDMSNGAPYPNYDGYAVDYPSSTASVLQYSASLMNDKSAGITPAATAPAAFDQMTPTAASTVASLTPQFVWAPAMGATSYSLVVSAHADMSNPVIDQSDIQATDYTATAALTPGTTYYWQVTATNGTGTTVATNAGDSFTLGSGPTTPLTIENFSEYNGSSTALAQAWQANGNGDAISVSLDSTHTDGSPYSMAVHYSIASKGYSGVEDNFTSAQDWSGYGGLSFWLQPDGSDNSVTVQFEANGIYWQTAVTATGTTGRMISLPFSDFSKPVWETSGGNSPDLGSINQMALYFGGSQGTGTMYFDSFMATPLSSGLPGALPELPVAGAVPALLIAGATVVLARRRKS
ncbi:MAG: cellulase family glycosylhydrolase [Firmicutes bacterium]|nr:cellulase family glycosylhydrolase [Bacillota bacterium]